MKNKMTMEYNKSGIILIIFNFFMLHMANAQSYDLVNLLPPAPNATSLIKYSGVNTGLSSGAANVSIPILDYTSKNISLPISINYTTTGFKVDEIASRIGNQWSLNAGGIITRAVLGSVDEKTTRIRPIPPLGESNDWPLFEFEAKLSNPFPLQGVGPVGAVDGQPDIFSFNFNGYSGKFILDTIGPNKALRPVALTNTGLKIELTRGGGAGQLISEIKITDGNGIQYIFGDDATEYTQNIGSCGAIYTNYPTAWYLKQIIHPMGDIVTFYYSPLVYSYITGINQSIYIFTGSFPEIVCGAQNHVFKPNPTNETCSNNMETTGVLLDSITSTHGNKMKFNYIDREDDNDKLVASISVYGPDHTTLFKTFNFEYDYASFRPFLISLTENNGSSQLLKKYRFSYNDPSHVPPALSFSQDYWGYFNGKTNTSFIPKPKDPEFAQTMPLATANRDPDPIFAAKGLLNLITYPTGGQDSIVYEGNQSYQVTPVYPSLQMLPFSAANNTATGTTQSQTSTTVAIISTRQQVTFSGGCATSSSLTNSTRQSTITIIDASNTVIDNVTILPTKKFNKTEILEPGTYRLQITLYGDHVSANGNLIYYPGNVVNQIMNINIGGVRVARILTYDSNSVTPIIKKYNYNKFSNPDQSSAGTISLPFYERAIKLWKPCNGGGGEGGIGDGLCVQGVPFSFNTSTSNSPLTLFKTSTPTSYANVTESFGENCENGGIEHIFTVYQDKDATIFRGERLVGAPNGNESCRNGFETYQGIFKLVNGQRVYVKKVYTHYDGIHSPFTKHPDFDMNYTGYIASENYHLYCSSTDNGPGPLSWERGNYNTNYYFIHKAWIYADTVKTLTYDINGKDYTQENTVYDYNNLQNAQPTLVTTYASNRDTLKTIYSYPADFVSSPPYSDMVSQNIINPVVLKTRHNNSMILDAIRTNYDNWGANIFAPQTVEYKKGAGQYQTRLHFYNYDNMGNVLSVSKESGPKMSFIWGYKGLFPIAKIENADYNSVTNALGGTTAVENFKNISKPTNAQLNSFLSPLRTNVNFNNSQIISNTYDPLVGMTSSTDTKGMTTTYEYDGFQRLINVKDKNGNIVKHTDYHYQGQ